jgi:hypothetical protein
VKANKYQASPHQITINKHGGVRGEARFPPIADFYWVKIIISSKKYNLK